jgi:hypothetical protein
MTNRRDNGGMLIHDGTRVEHISCGVKVDFKDMDELLFSQHALGILKQILNFPVPKTTRL